MRRILLCAIASSLVAACQREPESYRGAGLSVAPLAPSEAAAAYRAALSGAFNLGDPTLSILVDTLLLPRTPGLDGGARIDDSVMSALREDGVVKGTCGLRARATREPLRCDAARAGYAVRFSEPFTRSADSVQVYMAVEQYAIRGGPAAERLLFERVYQVVRRGSAWRAVREGRMPRP